MRRKNKIGGIAGNLSACTVYNCFSNMNISSNDTTSCGGISGDVNGSSIITNCYYVAGKGVNCASPNGNKTSVGAVTSQNGSVFSTDNTSLLYNGTLCEVLNSYRIDNDRTNTYKEWIKGEDNWPTFTE